MLFVLFNLTIVFAIIFLLFLLSMVWPPDSPWAPWWQMSKEVIRKICTLAHVSSKDTIYDLGCGTGNALLIAHKEFGAKGVGIEIDPLRYWIAKIRITKYESRIKIFRKNFFNVDLSPATVIFVYLIPQAIKRLVPKFLKEIKPGTRFISYVYPFPIELFKGKLKLIKEDKKNKIFVYKFA